MGLHDFSWFFRRFCLMLALCLLSFSCFARRVCNASRLAKGSVQMRSWLPLAFALQYFRTGKHHLCISVCEGERAACTRKAVWCDNLEIASGSQCFFASLAGYRDTTCISVCSGERARCTLFATLICFALAWRASRTAACSDVVPTLVEQAIILRIRANALLAAFRVLRARFRAVKAKRCRRGS